MTPTERVTSEIYKLRMSLRGTVLTQDDMNTIRWALESLWDEVTIITRSKEAQEFIRNVRKISDDEINRPMIES